MARELVGLLQVLGGEQHGGSLAGKAADHLPQGAAAVRIETGRRLVEEQDGRAADEAGRQVQAAAHPPGVGAHRPARGGLQPELGQQVRCPGPGLAPRHPAELPEHDEIGSSGHAVVQGGQLPGQPDPAPHGAALRHHVVAGHPGPSGVGAQQRGEHPHDGGLPRPVGSEQAHDGPRRDLQIDPAHSQARAEGLGQPACFDH